MAFSKFKHYLQAQQHNTTEILFTADTSMEGFIEGLQESFPAIKLTAADAVAEDVVGVSTESQQIDSHNKSELLGEVQDIINQNSGEEEAQTGHVHMYFIDNDSALNESDTGPAPVSAVIQSVLKSPKKTVVALMPEDNNISSVDDLRKNSVVKSLAKSVLGVEDVTTLVGHKALEDFLNNPKAYMPTDTVSTQPID